jgi:O-methyltransferase
VTVRPDAGIAQPQGTDVVRRAPGSMARRVRRALGFGWFYPGGQVPFLQRLGRRLLEQLATRYGLFLTMSMVRPYERISHDVFTRDTPLTMHLDYVRHATTELICRQIKSQGLPGGIAELGVYQGFWARVVNYHLPDKTIYLFDTFKGFDRRDLAGQERVGLSSDAPYEVGTIDPEESLRFLPHPERAVVRAGWFPATATGLQDETFCYVDIDTGLYDPTRAGLRWFYPRLVPGGFLSVIDYNNAHTPGVKMAVDEFADEIGLGFTVLPDHGASAIFVKPRR